MLPHCRVAAVKVAVGAVVSTFTVSAFDVDSTSPPLSTTDDLAVTDRAPSASVSVMHEKAPVVPSAVHVEPEATPSTYS